MANGNQAGSGETMSSDDNGAGLYLALGSTNGSAPSAAIPAQPIRQLVPAPNHGRHLHPANNNVTLALPAPEWAAVAANYSDRRNMIGMMSNGVGVRLSRPLASLPATHGAAADRRPMMMQRVVVMKWSEEAEERVPAAAGVMTDYRRSPIIIICVCHLHCFTTAEFVYHATGCRVADPHRHIMVLPPFPF